MSSQPCRHASGGNINRSQPVRFRFDGKSYEGYAGDTLASALLANGVRVVGRSFKYHRPRGVFSFGVEEPNALVELRSGNRQEPNIRATQIELFNGLVAHSQNAWPSVDKDVGEVNNLMSKVLPAGFYYKTFMWPASYWPRYEEFIRKAAGLGRAATEADPDTYAKRFAFCDVLVVGGGPAGLMATSAAAARGARVMVVDENHTWGGALRCSDEQVDGRPASEWVAQTVQALKSNANVKVLNRATAFGYYDQNLITVAERIADHQSQPDAYQPRQRIWWVRAKRVVLATGAIERPIVFPGNDVPGVMLASAVRGYACQHAVRCGERAVIFTNNDSGYETVTALKQVGTEVAAIVDSRASASALQNLDLSGIEVLRGHVIASIRGKKSVSAVSVQPFDGKELRGSARRIECDLLCVSGGWSPTVHLFSQSQGKLRYDDQLAAFVPDDSRQAERTAGSARGVFSLAECLRDGYEAGVASAAQTGFESGDELPIPAANDNPYHIQALWQVPGSGKRFVDIQNDVTAKDVELAAREGYTSVEHLKRYTTLGMGTDQGRTSNVNGLAIMADATARSIPEVGTTTFRPPYSPVTMGAIAGDEIGEHFMPLRRTPMHDWHIRNGAQMVNVGLWQRAQFYPLPGESMWDTIWREARHVREKVGVVDVTTLGKIEIQGKDAAEFLERVYINKWKSLKIGRARYGLMLREDGFVMDDGTTTRVAENEYYMTTTTANAGPVMAHLEFYAQTVWPELDVHLTSITDQWAGMALAGPHARDVLAAAVDGADVSNDTLPFMGFMQTTISGMPVRVFRITFSGELAYEIHMPSDYGEAVWQTVIDAGQAFDIAPYGTEALSILRIEKGHVVAAELDGRTIPADFGFAGMQKKDADFIGKRSLEREALQPERRKSLVGLISESGEQIPRGSQVVENPNASTPIKMLGHVSSQCYSPNIEKYIALALIENADQYRDQGKVLYAASPLVGKNVPVKVVHHVFIDPEGERCRG